MSRGKSRGKSKSIEVGRNRSGCADTGLTVGVGRFKSFGCVGPLFS